MSSAALIVGALLVVLVLAREQIGNRLWPDSQAAELRARAVQALQAGRLTAADGSGARELYEAALAMQPDQVEAQAGLAQVALAALAQAERALARGRFDDARAHLRLARELDAPRAGMLAVEGGLREAEARHGDSDALLARAEAAHAAGRLDGGEDAALPLYRRVLALSPRNQHAVEGREDALTDLLQPAKRALAERDMPTLARLIARAETFDAGHVELPELRDGLAGLREQAQRRLQAQVAARRHEAAAALCLQMREAQPGLALPAACTDDVLAGLAAKAKALAEDFDFTASEDVLAKARALAPDDPRVQQAARAVANARVGARRLPQAPRDPRRAEAEVQRLLALATQAQARGDWLTPPGESAWDRLRAARALAPDDPRVRAAWTSLAPAAEQCHAQGLRDNDLRRARTCFDAWRQLDPDDRALVSARQRLAQRWIAIGGERLEAGDVAGARRALGQAREIDPNVAGLREFAERLAKAQ